MATLQKIRSKGALLILFVGLALFAFIAEEGVRSLSSSRAESHQRIGEVYGKSINIQEFNDLVDEYLDVVKFSSGNENLTEEQMQQVRDQVWNTFVQTSLLEHECAELGITVTDAEMQEIIKTGQNPMLAQTPFRNQQTGAFDVEALNQFLTQYKSIKDQPGQPAEAVEYYTQLYNYWKFIEKNVRQQTLAHILNQRVGQGVGKMTTPNVRRTSEPLVEGCSLAHNVDKNRSTAAFKSVSKLCRKNYRRCVAQSKK